MSKQQVQEGSGCNNGGVSCIEPNFPQKILCMKYQKYITP